MFTGCGDNFFFFLDHFVTDGAVGYKGVRAVLTAGCGDFVFFAGGFGVCKLISDFLFDRHNTAGFTLFTLGQACCRAGCCLGFELDELFVVVCIEFECRGLGSTAAALHGDGTGGRTGRGYTVNFGCINVFTGCGDNFFFFLEHFVTDGAIGHKGVRAVLAAACGNFVFFAGGFGVGKLFGFGLFDRHNTAGFALFTLG